MKVTCWGTRGSIPAPGPDTVRYGGNTTCVELRLRDKTCMIFDAGTGIRKLGMWLLKQGEPIQTSIFFTHAHWDHIQGFPFFSPAYTPGNHLTVFGHPQIGHTVRELLTHQMEETHFPAKLSSMQAVIDFVDLGRHSVCRADAIVSCMPINHPGGAVGFRVEEQGRVFVFIPDNDLVSMAHPIFTHIVRFCKDADLLIHDAHFTPEEYDSHPGWGHSTYVQAVHLALEAGVRRLMLFHHAPEHNDAKVDQIVGAAREEIKQAGGQVECFGAMERESLIL